MKKRILALLLAMVMIFGMLPATAFAAAVELLVDGGAVDITDAAAGPYTISTLSVYLQGSYEPVSILSATQDGTTINIVLAEDTDPSAALQAGLGGSGQGTLQHSGNKCTLSNGTGTMNYSFTVRLGPQAVGSGNYTVNFSMPMGEAVSVTPPSGEGFTFTSGGAAYKNQPYTFNVAINEGYDGSNMQVSYLFGEESIPLTTGGNGNYTIDSVPGDITIVVSGVTAREKCNITRNICEGVTFSGAEWVYAGDPYTFTVAVDGAYDATNMKILVGGTEVGATAGEYKIDSVTADTTVTVTGVVKKNGYSVTWEEGTGYTITGQATSYAGEPYTFTVSVDDAIYWADRIVVKVNDESVTLINGSYTIEHLEKDTEITVENVNERKLFTVTKPDVPGITFTGGDNVREGKPYTFSIAVDTVHYLAAGMEVTVNGEKVTLDGGSYTIASADKDIAVAVSGVRAKMKYTVTKVVPDGMDDVTVNGSDTVLETDSYQFTVTVPELYNAEEMVVTYQMGESTGKLEAENGTYTIPGVTDDLTVTVSGLTRNEVCQIVEPIGKKFTFADDVDGFVYKNSDYTFTVTPQLGYVATVTVNGEPVTGSNNQYTVKADAEELMIAVSTQRIPLPDRELDVADNVIDIEDKLIANYRDIFKATAKTITISGVTVKNVYQNKGETTVYIILPSDTPNDATVTVNVVVETSKHTISGNTGSITLEEGEGGLAMTVKATYSSFNEGTVPYTLIFFREIPSQVVPGRNQETYTAEVWKNWPLEIDLEKYFTDADSYYLVDGETETPVDGKVYTYTPNTAGEHSLVFKAENEAGFSAPVTVTVTVKDVVSGVYIGNATANGSLNYVQFYNAEGELIEGVDVTFDQTARAISVALPKDYPVNGAVTAKFDLTQNASGYPFISTSTDTTGNRAYNSCFTEKSIALTNGAADFVFYYYNSSTGATNNGGQTRFTLSLKMKNDLPVLVENFKTPGTETVEVNQAFTLDLAPIFTDVDNDALTYQYRVGEGEWQNIEGTEFKYTNDLAADYELTFRAFDTKDYSTEYYTVMLTVENVKETYKLTVNVPKNVEPTFHSSDDKGTVGAALEATGENGVYTLSVPANITYIAWRAGGMGMSTAVPESKELTLVKADFTVMAGEAQDTGSVVSVKYGEVAAAGKDNSFLLLDGITYTVNATATVTGYKATEKKNYTPVAGENVFNLMQNHFTVIAPIGSVVTAGTLKLSYVYSFSEPLSREEDNEAGTVIYKFAPLATKATSNIAAFIRVQRPEDPDAVTYWQWAENDSMADGKTITVTEDMLFMNDGGAVDANTANRSFSPNDLDLGDIYININEKGYINLPQGGTKQLNVFRNWQAIEMYTNLMVAQPDFSYDVIDIEGNNVVSVQKDDKNSATATLTANNPGTAIVLVTYDAMYSTKTAYGSGASGGKANRFSAIWPERTGVFVVSVGKDGTGIQTNMTNNGRTFDAEHDPVFYTGTEGASVNFKPEEGCSVTVSRGIVGAEKLSFGAFTDNGVTVADDGTVTVSSLTTGRHIIRVEKNGVATYQVVTAQQVTVGIQDADGNAIDPDTELTAGHKITLIITGLTSPAEKMAAVYNYNFYLTYFDDEGNTYNNSTGAENGVYNFSSSTQRIKITIPADWASQDMTLNGYISVGGYYGQDKMLGKHREITYKTEMTSKGKHPNNLNLGALPEITLKIKPAPVPATGVTLDQEIAALRVSETLTLVATPTPANTTEKAVWKSTDEAVATVENGVVKAVGKGEATITVTYGEYSVQCTVTVSEAIAVTKVTLNQTNATIEPGKLLYLSAAVTPEDATDKTVIWTSSDETVAAVDARGVVSAVAEGTAVITATAGGVAAQCTVTVESKEDTDDTVSVYLSISHDAQYLKPTASGKVMALQKLDVPYFDLALYGLGDYKIPENNAGYGKVTALHLYIYATEVFYCGIDETEAGNGYLYKENLLGADALTISGGVGSSYITKFWGYDDNMNYYLNYQYPTYPGTNEGATSDRIVLHDGDIVTVAHFTDRAFYSDPVSVFNYITVANGSATVVQNASITLQVYRAGSDMGNGEGTHSTVKQTLDVYYAKIGSVASGNVTSWTKLGTTDATGKLTKTPSLDPGQYIVAVAGRYGVNNPSAVVSAPGGIILNVLESEAGKQVNTVIDLIDAIGEVTLDSEAAIQAARNAYDALTEEQQAAVTNYTTLTDAEAKLAQLKQEKADRDAADAVTAKINAIGTVTLDSKAAIEEARTAYDALTDAQKALVSEETLKKLTDAETAYAELIADEADKSAAKAVEEKIAAIGTVTLDSKQKIAAARQAYDALTDIQKQLVGNYEVLTAAEKKLAQLKDEAAADAVETKIAAIGTVTLGSEEKIQAARTAYDTLTDAQKALVENLSVLEKAEEMLELLKLAGTDITDIYKTTGDYLAGLPAPGIGSINGEWRVIGLIRAGREVPDSFYEAAVQYVQDNIDENGRLHTAKSTDNSRIIVALTAIGKDVTDVGGYDLLSGLDDMAYIGNQGINGTIWALIAFDAHDYEIPAGDVTREKLVQSILDAQLSDGGWALAGTVGDPDMTGMALQALAPYYPANAAVKSAVDKALTWLSGIQNQDGTFTGTEGTTSESLAQVITGLTALGINPETDSRFIKNGVSAVDALSKFYVEGGGFKHGLTGDRNMMATEQGYYALVSYYRLLQGKTSLYNMSDVTIVIPVYKIIEGANSDWQRDDEVLTIRADGEFSKFIGVQVDGVVINSKNYTAKAGSTVVTFKAEYLKTLSEGNHTITVSFIDGEASTTLTVLPSDEEAAKRVVDLIDGIGTVTKASSDKIKAARNAYDALTEDQKKLVTNYKTLTDAESAYDLLVSKISVSFTLLGCSKHGEGTVHTLAGGNLSTWIGTKTYKIESGATVKDVLEMALKEAGMSCKNPTGNYVESINGIGEFTNGSNSGWMYTLNGTHPGLGVAEQTVKDGDVIVFHYTDDYTKEDGSQGFGDRDEAAAETVEELIDAIGTVTLNSKSKIDAARKAYDDLTYTQKQLVGNYSKLTAAESKYAELKAADDEKKAEAVEDLIDAIKEGSTTFEEDVKAAQTAYNNLTADQKKLVDNYYKLVNYLKQLADEEDKKAAEAVEDLIDAIGTVTKDSEDKIKAARDAYEKLTDEQKALVDNLAVLEAAEARLAELKALADVENIYKATGDYLEDLGAPGVGSVGGEWMVIGLTRSGREIKDADAWYDVATKYVQENIDENGRLHQAKSTENARLILALTAIGKDVTNVGGYNLLIGLNSMEYIQKQGINGPIWALLAFDSGNYPVPEGDVSREALIQVLLDAQLSDGGWALTGTVSDPDITGMALQALAPYCRTNADAKNAVDEAVAALSMMQAADGSFASIDGSSSESVAQVIAALSALGIDANTDPRFIKNGVSALDALCTFYVEGGGFKHIPTGKLDGMATEQAYYALAAYFRMLDGKSALYNMTDVIDLGGDRVEEEPTETLPVETEPVTTEPAADEDDNKGGFPWWLVIVIVVLAGSIVVLVIVSKPKKHKYVR